MSGFFAEGCLVFANAHKRLFGEFRSGRCIQTSNTPTQSKARCSLRSRLLMASKSSAVRLSCAAPARTAMLSRMWSGFLDRGITATPRCRCLHGAVPQARKRTHRAQEQRSHRVQLQQFLLQGVLVSPALPSASSSPIAERSASHMRTTSRGNPHQRSTTCVTVMPRAAAIVDRTLERCDASVLVPALPLANGDQATTLTPFLVQKSTKDGC